jgi:hypothetical protein
MKSPSRNETARSSFGSNASASARGSSPARAAPDAVVTLLEADCGGTCVPAGPGAAQTGSAGAKERTAFGKTVLLKRSLVSFLIRAGGLLGGVTPELLAGDNRALILLKRAANGIVMRAC